MTNGIHDITKSSLGRLESDFLSQIGPQGMFTIKDAERILGPERRGYVRQFLAHLEQKGWIARIKPGLFVPIPLSSGRTRAAQVHEFLVAMRLVEPAAIAYYSAMSYHGFTEQIPREVFVATDHKVSRSTRQSLGISYRIIAQKAERFFGLRKEWIDERPFMVTDREKTLIDGLSLPQYVGGVATVARALSASWETIEEARLHNYAQRIGISAVVKRLGFLLETLSLGDAPEFRNSVRLSSGYPRLDPTLPAAGTYNRRWGLLINAKVGA